MKISLKRVLPVIGIVMFFVAVWVLKNEVQQLRWDDIKEHLSNIPAYRIISAILLTALLYTVLTGYDFLAARYAGSNIAYRHIALASFLGYAFSHNITPSLVTGASARFRIYSNHGLSLIQVTQIVGYCALSLWVGFLLVGAVIFLFIPIAIPEEIGMPFGSLNLIGLVFLMILTTYVIACYKIREPFDLWGRKFLLPPFKHVFGQMSISSMDWIFSAGILYLLLPSDGDIIFPLFIGIYMLGFMSGILSQVPGGLGVFETVVLLLSSPYFESDEMIGTLLAFRALYFLIPLLIAVSTLGIYETLRNKYLSEKHHDIN